MPKMLHALGDTFHIPRDRVINCPNGMRCTLRLPHFNRVTQIDLMASNLVKRKRVRVSGGNIRRNSIRAFRATIVDDILCWHLANSIRLGHVWILVRSKAKRCSEKQRFGKTNFEKLKEFQLVFRVVQKNRVNLLNSYWEPCTQWIFIVIINLYTVQFTKNILDPCWAP